jgi:transposase InsO family protein
LFIRTGLGKLVVPDRQQPKPRLGMNIHTNARTMPYSRLSIASRVEAGEKVAEVATDFCSSEQTVRKWVRRWRAGGEIALQDRSSTPARRRRLPVDTVARIEELRRQRLRSPAISRQLGVAISTVTSTLRRLGLNRLQALDPPVPITRYQRHNPGELLHVDTKKLSRIDGVGHRITGWRQGTVNRHHGIGWECLHVCVDDASRLAYTEILPDERKESAVSFLERVLPWFARHGVVVERVMTDNDSCYRNRAFRQACSRNGLRHLRTRPYTPRTNGKAERFIQTVLRECAYSRRSNPHKSVPRPCHVGHTSTMSTARTPRLPANRQSRGSAETTFLASIAT